MLRSMQVSFLEPVVNREASQYITDNYDEILRQIPKLGVCEEKAVDLLNDVFVSIIEAENEGNGYDINRANDGDCILVSQFVYGRLKRYAMNTRYRTDVVEKKLNKDKTVKVEVMSSSYSGNDYDTLDSFQKAYATAGSFDDIEAVEDTLSITERIDFCIDFDYVVGMSMLALFKNIESLGQEDICKSVFEPLKDALKIHDEFAEAFKNVVEYAMTHKARFESILARY